MFDYRTFLIVYFTLLNKINEILSYLKKLIRNGKRQNYDTNKIKWNDLILLAERVHLTNAYLFRITTIKSTNYYYFTKVYC